MTNNSVSLLQSLLLKQPAVRAFFNIPIVPPKPQPGQPGYVPEPSFSDAFKNMQVGMQEKWTETQEKAEAERARKEQWEGRAGKKAELYVPQAPSAGSRRRADVYEPRAPRRKVGEYEKAVQGLNGATSLLESDAPPAKTGEIYAQPVEQTVNEVNGARESIRARRLQIARERRAAQAKE